MREKLRQKFKGTFTAPGLLLHRRQVVLVWLESDSLANTLCKQFSTAFPTLCHPLPLKSSEYEWCVYSAPSLPGNSPPIYLFVSGSTQPPMPPNNSVADCLFLSSNKPDSSLPEGYKRAWYTANEVHSPHNEEDSILALLVDYSLSEESLPLSSFAPAGNCYKLKSSLHNANEYSSAQELSARVQAQLTGCGDNYRNKLKSIFIPRNIHDCLQRRIHNLDEIDELPIFGYEKLKAAITVKRGLFYRNTKKENRPSVTIGDSLRILFGTFDTDVIPEWFLSQSQTTLIELCREEFSLDSVQRKCYEFPLVYLQKNIHDDIRSFRTIIEEELANLHLKRQKAMQMQYTPHRTNTLQDLMDGLDIYRNLFAETIRLQMDMAYWVVLSEILSTPQLHNAMENARIPLEKALNELVISYNLHDIQPRGVINWRIKNIQNLIQDITPSSELNVDDVSQLALDAQRLCPDPADGHLINTVFLVNNIIADGLRLKKDSNNHALFVENSNGILTGQASINPVKILILPGLDQQQVWQLQIEEIVTI